MKPLLLPQSKLLLGTMLLPIVLMGCNDKMNGLLRPMAEASTDTEPSIVLEVDAEANDVAQSPEAVNPLDESMASLTGQNDSLTTDQGQPRPNEGELPPDVDVATKEFLEKILSEL